MLIPCVRILAFISNGFCVHFGPPACFVAHAVQLHFLTHSLYLLLLSFFYRLFVLHRAAPKIKTLLSIIFLFYIPSLFQMTILLTEPNSKPERIRRLVEQRFPRYDVTGSVINGYEDWSQPAPLFATLHAICPTLPIYIVILVLRRRIVMSLERKKRHMGPETREMHDQLLKALSIQAVLPAIISLAIVSFLLGQLRILNHPLLENLSFFIVLLVPSFSPLISFVYIRPFREEIVKIFRPKRRVLPKTSGNSMGRPAEKQNK